MGEVVKIFYGEEITSDFSDEWILLFARSYGASQEKAELIFRKYRLNKPRFCVLYVNERMVAAYSGLELTFGNSKIFLSTDTMSDGTKKGASVLLANHLYEQLFLEDFLAVCGFPNDKIRKLRQKRLGWVISGNLFLWLGVPFFWKFLYSEARTSLWSVVRPKDGFFGKNIWGINLLGRDKLLTKKFGLVMSLSSQRPGFFFLRIPNTLFSPRTFGYRFLNGSQVEKDLFLEVLDTLDLETIDIP
jgi:hypothetical protein